RTEDRGPPPLTTARRPVTGARGGRRPAIGRRLDPNGRPRRSRGPSGPPKHALDASRQAAHGALGAALGPVDLALAAHAPVVRQVAERFLGPALRLAEATIRCHGVLLGCDPPTPAGLPRRWRLNPRVDRTRPPAGGRRRPGA